MNKLIKSSLYLTSVGLIGVVISDILFAVVAKKCQYNFGGMGLDKCQTTMIGLSVWTHYIFLPIILISFALAVVPGIIYLCKKKPLDKAHVKLIIYAVVAILAAEYLGHILIRLMF
ncbi:MAG: hypothetical protein JWO73_71 [Candidatus Taylorbacteria bacterium]|nr:hypothetical protein [Candidatus Taylorbacteria bacterium]